MKYKAINDWVIVSRDYTPKAYGSTGIVLSESSEGQVFVFDVVDTTELTAQLAGLRVYVERHKVKQLNQSDTIVYGSVAYTDIIAVEELQEQVIE